MRQNSTFSFEDERSEVGENVTNLVSVLPATLHCKPNYPVHPHSKPKSGLGRGYISSDAIRRKPLGAAVPSSLLSGAGHLAWKRVHPSFILQRRAYHSSSEEEFIIIHPPNKSASFFYRSECILHHPSSILSTYLLHLLRRVPPSTEVSSSFIYPHLPKEVFPVREVAEHRSLSPIPLLLAASSNSHPVNLCSTGPAIHRGECIRTLAK